MLGGIQDGAQILPAYTAKLFPDYTVFSLPYMFPDPDKGSEIAWRAHEAGLLTGTEKLHVVTVFTNDNGGIHLSVKLNTIGDLKGNKIRAAGPEEAKVISILGGSPVSMYRKFAAWPSSSSGLTGDAPERIRWCAATIDGTWEVSLMPSSSTA